MSLSSYSIRPLARCSPLDDIHRLTHDTLVEAGDVAPRPDQKITLYPHLDVSPNTIVLVAEREGTIVGTNSLTIDGPDGLSTDFLFQRETDQLRRETLKRQRLGCSWRMATRREFRSQRTLIVDLMRQSMLNALAMDIDILLLAIDERRLTFYERLLGATAVTRKPASLDGNITVNAALVRVNMVEGWAQFKRVLRENKRTLSG